MPSPDAFPETVWSDVLAASERSDPDRAAEALRRLCEQYHRAIRAWFRRQPWARDAAEDLTQEFLLRWLTRERPLGGFQKGQRRFREFLGTCLRRFGATEYERRQAQKRGGAVPHVSLEDADSTGVTASEPSPLDLLLAQEVGRDVAEELAARWAERVPRGGWSRLRRMALGQEEARGYTEIARELGVPVGTIKGWIFRVRQDHYEAFARRARALAQPDEAPDETRHLFEIWVRFGDATSPDQPRASRSAG